jgi:hypothetical protein
VGGRIVREYVGTGSVGELAAQLDAEERVEREARRGAFRAERSQARDMTDALADLEALTRQAVTDTLHAEGFHRYKGQWRRRRAVEHD